MTALEQPGHVHDVQRVDGYILCVACGEILGTVKGDTNWFPQSDTDVDWLLELFLDAEGGVAAVDRKERIVLTNLALQRGVYQRRLKWLQVRFGGFLEQFTRDRLAGQKTRSLTFEHGRLKLHKSPSRWRLPDATDDATLAMVRETNPDAIKRTEAVLVTRLSEEDWARLAAVGLAEKTAESESFSIDTSEKK